MKKSVVWIIIFFAILLQVVLFYSFKAISRNEGSLFKNQLLVNNSGGDKDNLNRPEDSNSSTTNSYGGSSSGSSSSSGGGSGSSSGSGSQGSGCYDQQISYSLTRLDDRQGSLCSLLIKNLDYDTSGDFGVNFSFFYLNNSLAKNEVVESFINSRDSKYFNSSFESEENVSCDYTMIKVPKKKVCFNQ